MSRIIAGVAKGAMLRTPKGDATRPTTDRLREAVFSALAVWAGPAAVGGPAGSQLAGLAFLDLYAGSGAVGLEAASRGAKPVVLVEANHTTARLIRENAASIGCQVNVISGSVESYLAVSANQLFDIVFFDPPYDVSSQVVADQVAAVVEGGWLASDGLVIVERSARTPAPVWPAQLRVRSNKRYGESVVFFLEADVPLEEKLSNNEGEGSL